MIKFINTGLKHSMWSDTPWYRAHKVGGFCDLWHAHSIAWCVHDTVIWGLLAHRGFVFKWPMNRIMCGSRYSLHYFLVLGMGVSIKPTCTIVSVWCRYIWAWTAMTQKRKKIRSSLRSGIHTDLIMLVRTLAFSYFSSLPLFAITLNYVDPYPLHMHMQYGIVSKCRRWIKLMLHPQTL